MIVSRERADIKGPQEVCKFLKKLMAKKMDKIERDKEHFFVVILNTRSQVRCVDLVSTGTINASLVTPREIFRRAVTQGASSIVLAHNHPSGDSNPSDEDMRITRKLVDAGKVLGIEVVDHIVVGKTECSFREKGII